MSKVVVTAGQLFVRLKVPYLYLPHGAKVNAAKMAKDFAEFIDGVAIGRSQTSPQNCPECHGDTTKKAGCQVCEGEGLVGYTAAEALEKLLDSGVTAHQIFDEYRGEAEKARGIIRSGPWGKNPDFNDGYKWMTPKFAEWFVYNAIPHQFKIDATTTFEGRPDLTKVLIEHPRGIEFMLQFVEEFRFFLYGK